jgi:hypothetical protein
MSLPVVNLFEGVPQIRESESADGRSHLRDGRGCAHGESQRQQSGDANAERQRYSSRSTGVLRRTMVLVSVAGGRLRPPKFVISCPLLRGHVHLALRFL